MYLKKLACLILALILVCTAVLPCTAAANGAVKPSTWAATDGLGRTLSQYDSVGGEKQDRFRTGLQPAVDHIHGQITDIQNAAMD